MPDTRVVSGTLLTLEGQPVRNERITIRFAPGTYTNDALWLESLTVKTTDENGRLTAELFCNEAGDSPSRYSLELRGEPRSFVVPAGSGPLSWSEVFALGMTAAEPNYSTLAAYVDRQLAAIPPDGSGQSFAYVHTQLTPASEWTAAHPFGVPAASIQLEVGGRVWLPDVVETNSQHVVVAFPSPQTGVLRLVRGI